MLTQQQRPNAASLGVESHTGFASCICRGAGADPNSAGMVMAAEGTQTQKLTWGKSKEKK